MLSQLTGLHRRTTDGYDKKIGSSDTEQALVLSAYIPQHKGDIDRGVDVPLMPSTRQIIYFSRLDHWYSFQNRASILPQFSLQALDLRHLRRKTYPFAIQAYPPTQVAR